MRGIVEIRTHLRAPPITSRAAPSNLPSTASMIAHVRRILERARPDVPHVQIGTRLLAQMATRLGELQIRAARRAQVARRDAE